MTFLLSDFCLTKAISNENEPDIYGNFFYKKTQEHFWSPVHLCAYHYFRQTAEIGLKRKIDAENWDYNKGRGKGRSEAIRNLNTYLDQVQAKLLLCHGQLVNEDKIISSNAIKMRFLGEDEVSRALLDLIDYHNGNMILVLKPGTMKNYYTTEKYIRRYLKTKLKREDIYLKQFNYGFL